MTQWLNREALMSINHIHVGCKQLTLPHPPHHLPPPPPCKLYSHLKNGQHLFIGGYRLLSDGSVLFNEHADYLISKQLSRPQWPTNQISVNRIHVNINKLLLSNTSIVGDVSSYLVKCGATSTFDEGGAIYTLYLVGKNIS